jgi:hypothetical protein
MKSLQLQSSARLRLSRSQGKEKRLNVNSKQPFLLLEEPKKPSIQLNKKISLK